MASIPVQPSAGASPEVPVVPQAPPEAVAPAPAGPPAAPEDDSAGLSPDLVQIPAMQALLAGSPAAVSVPIAGFEKTPEGKAIVSNKDSLLDAGVAFYTSLSGDLGVMFNRMFVSDAEIKAADSAGKLAEVAPPLANVNQMVGSAGGSHPLLGELPPSKGFQPGTPPPITPLPDTGGGPITPASPAKKIQDKVLGAKMLATAPGSPTSGPKPGAGRLLNQILKPVI